jgi:hypothetical protein
MRDAAYFMSNSLSLEDRHKHEKQLFNHYIEELRRNSEMTLDMDTVWREYRRQTLFGIMLAASALIVVEVSERGRALGLKMLAGHAQQAVDLGTRGLIEEDLVASKGPLRAALLTTGSIRLRPASCGTRVGTSTPSTTKAISASTSGLVAYRTKISLYIRLGSPVPANLPS